MNKKINFSKNLKLLDKNKKQYKIKLILKKLKCLN